MRTIVRWIYDHAPDPIRTEVPRWVLVPFAILPIGMGWIYATADPLRFSSPSFGAAKELADRLGAGYSMTLWGIVWLVVGVVIAIGVALRKPPFRYRWITITGLGVGCVACAWWAIVYSFQANANPAAAPTGGVVWSFISSIYLYAAIYVASAGRG